MEFGANFQEGVMYEGEAFENSQEEYEKFLNRVNVWLDRRNIRLGEGVILYMDYSEGPGAFRLKAPRISGPSEPFVERISE
jgi:hypothetical protein